MKNKIIIILILLLGISFGGEVFADCPVPYWESGDMCCKPAKYVEDPMSIAGGSYECSGGLTTEYLIGPNCCYRPTTSGLPGFTKGYLQNAELDNVSHTTVALGESISGSVSGEVTCYKNDKKIADIEVNFGDGNTVIIGECACIASPDIYLSETVSCSAEFTYTYQAVNKYQLRVGSGMATEISVVEKKTVVAKKVKNPFDPGEISTLSEAIEKVSDIILYILSGIAVAFIILGGVTIMTASGQPNKIAQGKQIITITLIGLVVILTAKGILDLVMNILNN